MKAMASLLACAIAAAASAIANAADDNNTKWSFAVFGDTRSVNGSSNGVNTEVFGKIAQAIADEPGCELAIVSGDLIMGGYDPAKVPGMYKDWLDTAAPMLKKGIKIYPVRGNHETYSDSQGRAWMDAFGSKLPADNNTPDSLRGYSYSVTHKNALFIAVDEYVGAGLKDNLPWLKKKIAGNKQPLLFTFGHIPAFQVGEHDDDAYLGTIDLESRDDFWKTISDAGCPAYFCGHVHLTSFDTVEGSPTLQAVAGDCGANKHKYSPSTEKGVKNIFNDDKHVGYLLVTVDGASLRFDIKCIDDDGRWKTFLSLDRRVSGSGSRIPGPE